MCPPGFTPEMLRIMAARMEGAQRQGERDAQPVDLSKQLRTPASDARGQVVIVAPPSRTMTSLA